MKHFIALISFIILTVSVAVAQDDYVISDPKEDKKEYKIPTTLDSNRIANPDYTSYFLNATAYTLEKKRMRLSGTDLIFIKASYGITDNTMLSANISLLSTFTLSLKQQINLGENVKIGLSGSAGRLFMLTLDSVVYFGGGQAMITIGDRQNNITAGTGFYYLRPTFDMFGNGKNYYLTNNVYIGIQKQLGIKIYFMVEGMYFVNSRVITGAIGMKIVMGDRVSLNFGVMPLGWNDPTSTKLITDPIPIPLISFRILLGKNR